MPLPSNGWGPRLQTAPTGFGGLLTDMNMPPLRGLIVYCLYFYTDAAPTGLDCLLSLFLYRYHPYGIQEGVGPFEVFV